MSWKIIKEEETDAWNEKLKQTKAPFTQYPYYALAEHSSRLSRVVLISYIQEGIELAFSSIMEIGIYPLKMGVIEGGPVLLQENGDLPAILEQLKQFARDRGYIQLQIRPMDNKQEPFFKKDPLFIEQVFFPFHKKEAFDLNIYNRPPEELLAGLKGQCRRKIVLAGRVPYKFFKVEDELELKYIFNLFKQVSREKGYNFMFFHVFQNLFRKGKKHNLCDIYVAALNDEIINAVIIVKDAHSYYHLSSALLVKGFRENESPSAKLHYFLMQDCFYSEQKDYYNISYGGSDNLVRFKDLFNPIQVERPRYYTYIINKTAVSFFQKISQERAVLLRSGLKKIRKLLNGFLNK